jgi:hypothetical protein
MVRQGRSGSVGPTMSGLDGQTGQERVSWSDNERARWSDRAGAGQLVRQ